jgi:hypothetical protein
MYVNIDKRNIEIDIIDAQEWVETIRKTAYEICNDLARDRMTVHH